MDCTPPASTGELAESGRCFVQMVDSEISAESQRVENAPEEPEATQKNSGSKQQKASAR